MKFKTNAKCMGCVTAIKNALAPIAPADKWEFDLSSPDKTLTYLGEADDALEARIISMIKEAGFKAERL
ncbi:MAG: heavy metal transport/detoxification protein [Muribaculaceae bacterium]|nr:heavy metal transport/detoxification protein [Muribaculaceae bacterium]